MKDAIKYIEKFPKLTNAIDKEVRQMHRKYLLFDHKGKCYCTACEKEYTLNPWEIVKHKSSDICRNCGNGVECIDVTKNYKGYIVHDIAYAVIYLAGKDGNLYVRCIKQEIAFKHGLLRLLHRTTETQRYVFTPKGAARFAPFFNYISNDNDWCARTRVENPNFLDFGYSSKIHRTYKEINLSAAIEKTWLKYSAVEEFMKRNARNDYAIHYLNFYTRHKGVERLIKCGFCADVYDMVYNRYKANKLVKQIDWNQTEVNKMLGINKREFRFLVDGGISLYEAEMAKSIFGDYSLEQAINLYSYFGGHYPNIQSVFSKISPKNANKLKNYLKKQNCSFSIYKDYIDFCEKLDYDLTSPEILFPPHLQNAHDRAYSAIESKKIMLEKQKIREVIKKRKPLEFEKDNLVLILPRSPDEIIYEGQVLRHCVGGYAQRHFNLETTILFIRKIDEINKPYFTIEVSNDFRIVQCHGYRNELESKKPEEIKELEKAYREYLTELKNKPKTRRQKVCDKMNEEQRVRTA